MTSFLDSLHEPERHCSCGHHEGSHCHGFSNQACMWCDCRTFADPENPLSREPVGTTRRFLSRR